MTYDQWKTTDPADDRGDPEGDFEVTVWDIVKGDIVKKLWHATEAEAREVEDYYRDEPGIEVHVEEN